MATKQIREPVDWLKVEAAVRRAQAGKSTMEDQAVFTAAREESRDRYIRLHTRVKAEAQAALNPQADVDEIERRLLKSAGLEPSD